MSLCVRHWPRSYSCFAESQTGDCAAVNYVDALVALAKIVCEVEGRQCKCAVFAHGVLLVADEKWEENGMSRDFEAEVSLVAFMSGFV